VADLKYRIGNNIKHGTDWIYNLSGGQVKPTQRALAEMYTALFSSLESVHGISRY